MSCVNKLRFPPS